MHDAYLPATTITCAGIVSCQIGTASAARTDRALLFAAELDLTQLTSSRRSR